MVDTFTFTFHQGKGLGFTVIEKTSPNMLSNTVIQEITGEPALSSPLKPGDALISANGKFLMNMCKICLLFRCSVLSLFNKIFIL